MKVAHIVALVVVLLSACVEGTLPAQCQIDILEECGQRPARPPIGQTVYFANGNAIQPREEWIAFDTWQRDLDTWARCVLPASE